MNNYELIIEDLQQTLPAYMTAIPPFYSEIDQPEMKLKTLNRQIRRSKSTNNRVELLVNPFYLGELLELNFDHQERKRGIKIVSQHYQSISIKLYYIYETLGVEHIYRSKNLTPTMLKRISKPTALRLGQEAANIAGAQLEEEEVVNQ